MSPSQSTSQVEPGQVRRGPSGTPYKILSLHGGYAELADVKDPGIISAGPGVWVSDLQFSSSIENVAGWEIVMCCEEHDEPTPATTMLHEEDDPKVWVPVCDECAEHAV